MFVVYLYVTLLPFPILLGLALIYIAAFFLPSVVVLRPAVALSVVALGFLAAYVAYTAAQPSVWVEGHPVLRYLTAVMDWDLLPLGFWKFASAFVSLVLTFISAWAGVAFGPLVIKEG